MTTISECILCQTPLLEHLAVKDYFHTQENFELLICPECRLLHTSPAPPPNEIGRYYDTDDYLSHTTDKNNFIARIYNIIRSISIKRKIKLLNQYSPPGRLLDYGCGSGEFMQACQQSGWIPDGLEPNAQAREKARSLTGASIMSDRAQINQSYHVITLWHVLEHLYDPLVALRFLRDHLHADGVIILALPNYESPDAEHYGKFWAGYDVPRHLFHFSQLAVSRLASQAGMNVVSVHPMKFDAYYVSLLSEKYRSPDHFVYLRALWNGWQSNRQASSQVNYSSLIYVLKPNE